MTSVKEEIINLKNQALARIMDTKSVEEIEQIRIDLLGRSGKLNKKIQEIRKLEGDERKEVGYIINETKKAIEEFLGTQKSKIRASSASKNAFDETIPGEKLPRGHLHLVTTAINEISSVFEKIGFVRVRYPEVEWDWFAFEALNFPEDHPARDDWETFFVDAKKSEKYGPMILTPHTSSGQVREMQRVKNPPIRMINIAKCYRRQLDSRHLTMFHQFEGLVIDENITLVNLKGTLDYFAKTFFGQNRKTRLRPYHFQFTEPSFEVDITCGICDGKGCKLCKEGWLELGGAGMVHPNVLKNGGIDPKKYTGFAFGWGVERTFMMKAGINLPDIRLLYSSDLRFLRQF
jgi:phenylalanyl-tRNA synthetase alpha chain